jgi:Ca2+-binding RTX toxin-like protein
MLITAPNGVVITRIGTLNTYEGALAQVNYYQNEIPIQAVTLSNTLVRVIEIVKQSDTSVAIDVPYTVSGNTITFESAITELFIIRFFTSDLLTSFTIGTTESGYGRGIDSVTIGRVNAATMDYSTAVGHHLHALAGNQFVFGRYNEDDASGKYIFIFGNGTSSSERKNAMCIKKSDNTLLMALDTNAAADTDDGELTAVLGDLGILSNVIE